MISIAAIFRVGINYKSTKMLLGQLKCMYAHVYKDTCASVASTVDSMLNTWQHAQILQIQLQQQVVYAVKLENSFI